MKGGDLMNESYMWDKFYRTGSVKDYLEYKQKQGGANDADNGKGLSAQREILRRK